MNAYPNTESGRVDALADAAGNQSRLWFDGETIYVTDVATPRIIPTADYIDRFTAAEQLAITTLAYAGSGDAQAVLLLLKTQTRPEIDLDAQTLIAGLDYLVSKGALASGRPTQIRA